MRTVCCVCRRVKCKGDWLEEMIDSEIRVSHGFCPECFDKTMAQFSIAWSSEQVAQSARKPVEQDNDALWMAKTA